MLHQAKLAEICTLWRSQEKLKVKRYVLNHHLDQRPAGVKCLRRCWVAGKGPWNASLVLQQSDQPCTLAPTSPTHQPQQKLLLGALRSCRCGKAHGSSQCTCSAAQPTSTIHKAVHCSFFDMVPFYTLLALSTAWSSSACGAHLQLC